MCRPVTGSCPTVSGAATWPPLAEADSEYVFTPNELVPTVVPNPHPQVSASGDDAPVVAPAPPGHQRPHQGQRLAMRCDAPAGTCRAVPTASGAAATTIDATSAAATA